MPQPPYTPANLRNWVSQCQIPPDAAAIAGERARAVSTVHLQEDSFPGSAHRSFIEDALDRRQAFQDLVLDMKNTASALERLTDGVVMTFAARTDYAEHIHGRLTPGKIEVAMHTPRQYVRDPAFKALFADMEETFRVRVAEVAIRTTTERRANVRPGAGQRFTAEGDLVYNEVQAAIPALDPPRTPQSRQNMIPGRPTPARPSLQAPQTVTAHSLSSVSTASELPSHGDSDAPTTTLGTTYAGSSLAAARTVRFSPNTLPFGEDMLALLTARDLPRALWVQIYQMINTFEGGTYLRWPATLRRLGVPEDGIPDLVAAMRRDDSPIREAYARASAEFTRDQLWRGRMDEAAWSDSE